MRLVFVWLCLLSLSLSAQDPVQAPSTTKELGAARYKIKLSLFDQSVFSLPFIKLHNELLVGGETTGDYNYLSADLGYNYYSVDEQAPASGIYTGLRFNHYLPSYRSAQNYLSVGIFWQQSVIKDYLKVDRFYPGLGTYSAYEKMRYSKIRYGGNIEIMKQYALYGPVFFEYTLGLGVLYFETKTPDNVTQTTFVNGTSYQKKELLPTVVFSLKLGYLLY